MAIGALPQPGRLNDSQLFGAFLNQSKLNIAGGIGQAKYNPHEVTALSNYLERSRRLELELREGGISADERQQLLDRVEGYQRLADQYREGDYRPNVEKDAPFQTPKEAMAGLGLTEPIRGLTEHPDPWDPSTRRLYRKMTDWQAAPDGQSLPHVPEGPTRPPAPVRGIPAFTDASKANFAAWDTDKNGNLSALELNSAMADRANTGVNAQALAALRRHHAALAQNDGQEGLSLTDLEAFANGSADPALAQRFGKANSSFAGTQARGAGKSELGVIDPSKLQQGLAGSCMLLSGLSGMKAEDLQKMIKPNDDGTYTVTFANGTQATVPSPTEAERAYGARGEDGGCWPTVIESALGKVLGERDGRDPRSAMDGIRGEDLIAHLGGSSYQQVNFDRLSHNEARDRLAALDFQQGGPIVAGTRPHEEIPPEWQPVEKLENGLFNNHAYAVLNFDPATNLVTLRNPHGRGGLWGADPDNDGTFQMPFDRFYASFANVFHGQDPGC